MCGINIKLLIRSVIVPKLVSVIKTFQKQVKHYLQKQNENKTLARKSMELFHISLLKRMNLIFFLFLFNIQLTLRIVACASSISSLILESSLFVMFS